MEKQRAGDLVFCRSPRFLGRAIRWAERLRRDGEASGAQYNHVAWLDHQDADGNWIVGQAISKGVSCDMTLGELLSKNEGLLLPYPDDVNQDEMLEFLRAQIGAKYGFLTLISILLTMFSPRFVNVMLPDTWICSAVVAEGLRAGGWTHNWPDIYSVSPANLYLAIKEPS